MMLLPLVALLQAAPLPENTVALVAYQGAGKTAELTTATLEALTREVSARGLGTAPAADQQRAAAMCGEDPGCLATIGKLAKVGWVLAIGVGSAGKQTLFSALLIDVEKGSVHQRFETKSKTFEVAPTAKAAVEALFAGVTLKEAPPPPPLVNDVPLIVKPPEPAKTDPPIVATAPAPRFRGAAIATGIGTGVAAATGITFSILAATNFSKLSAVPASDRPGADGTQRAFNLTADVALGVAIAAGVTTLVLLLLDAGGPTP